MAVRHEHEEFWVHIFRDCYREKAVGCTTRPPEKVFVEFCLGVVSRALGAVRQGPRNIFRVHFVQGPYRECAVGCSTMQLLQFIF